MSISPMLYLKFAKDISPEIFENKTPRFQINLLNFINGNNKYKAVAVFRGAGKTTILNNIYVLSRVYFEAEPFILIVSSVEDKAFSFLDAVKKSIDKASVKGYALSRGKVWNKDKIEIIVNAGLKNKHGKSIEKKCFIATISAGQDPRGVIVDNTRPTLIITDDLESNSGQFAVSSKSNRHKLRRWFFADLLPALHPIKGRVVVIGTIIHDDSILNNIIHPKESNDDSIKWDTIKIPIINNGKSSWPSRFSMDNILKIRATLKLQGLDNEFYQEYMCAAIDPTKVLFKQEFFKYFDEILYDIKSIPLTINITDGVNLMQVQTRPAISIKFKNEHIDLNKCRVFTTIDLASAQGRDKTAIVTSAIDYKNRIFVIDVCSGHWTPFEKSVEIIRIFKTFNPERIGIERAGMQNDFFYTIDVIQKMTGIKLPTDALSHHGKSKNIRISNLEPYYRTGQIYHNASIFSTQELEAQLVTFDPDVESKSDDLMDALAYLLEYIVGRFFDEKNSYDVDEYIEPDEWA